MPNNAPATARHRNTGALFVSTMSDCGMGADGTGGWRAGSNQFESQSMFNPVSALPVQCSAHPVLQSMFHSQCIAMFHSQCSTLPLCSIFYPSRRTVVACQCNGECHPVMLDVMTESRKLERRDQQAARQQVSEKVPRVPPRSTMCSLTPLAAIHHQYYNPPNRGVLCKTVVCHTE